MRTVTSLGNERIKAAIKLRDRRGRDKQKRIIIDGVRELGHALAAGAEVTEAFYCAKFADSVADALLPELRARAVELSAVTPLVWDKLAYGKRRDGIVAIAKPPQRRLADIPIHAAAAIVVLDALEKPGNLGAIIRSADATNVDGIVVTNGATDLYNPNTIRASIGTVFRIPTVSTSRAEAIDWLRTHKIATYLARVATGVRYTEPDYTQRCALVMGDEAAGLGDSWNDPSFQAIHLPMYGTADSLNVAAATAVLLYEVLRQRAG